MSKGIRLKIFIVLMSLIMLYGFTTILNLLYNNEKDKINEFNNTVKTVQTLLLKDANTINDFFIYEVNNNLFYNTGYSLYLEEHRVYVSSINYQINALLNSEIIDKFGLRNQIAAVTNKFYNYESDFNDIVTSISENKVEELSNTDFTSNGFSQIKENLDNKKNAILDEIGRVSDRTIERKKKMAASLRRFFQISVITILVVGVLISIFLSKQTTKRIILLSDTISDFVNSKFTSNDEIQVDKKNDEIGQLIGNFLILRKEVWNQIHFLEENIRKRTEKIAEQNDEILAQHDEVIEKNRLIQKQNKKILDSIRYAQTIQEAFLPDQKVISKVFPEYFIIYKPKDLVSGDFYWFKDICEEKISILAVADCTGHGVPGGFMSMLGNSLLNEIVLRKKNYNAATILDNLRDRVLETLQGEGKLAKSHDGMDIALVIFNHYDNTVEFAGANRPLYLIRGKKVNKICGDKMPIGNHVKGNRPFTSQRISLEPDDTLYLLSDGYVDQFGHEDKRKFRSNQLRQILEDHHEEPMATQGEIYESLFEYWRGDTEQTDDVLLIGIKPNFKYHSDALIEELTHNAFSL